MINIKIILGVLIGLLNRVRGSGWEGKTSFTKFVSELNKWWLAIAFGLLHGFENVTRIGQYEYTADFNFTMFLLCATAVKIAYTPGWDVSEFHGNPAKVDNNFLDDIDRDRFKDRPLLHCTYRLTLRGLFFGLMIALPTHSLVPVLAGATMGGVYFLSCYIASRKYRLIGDGLRLAEPVFGVIMVLSTLL